MILERTKQINHIDAPADLLAAALFYGRLGWAVVPLQTPTAGVCSCSRGVSCTSPGKHPRTGNGLKNASKDPATIRQWWERWPSANIGIVTGQVSGLIVIDIDGSCELPSVILDIPRTTTATTARGRHIYLRMPDGLSIKNRTKIDGLPIDVRGDGGYVVGSPSVHASGAVYEWHVGPDDCELADVPDDLLEWLATPTPKQQPSNSANSAADASGDDDGEQEQEQEQDDGRIANFRLVKFVDEETGKSKIVKIGLAQHTIASRLIKVVGNWPKAADGMLFVEGAEHIPRMLESGTQLFAWIGSKSKSRDNLNNWADRGDTLVSRGQFYEHLRMTVPQYDAVEPYPHEPPLAKHYYMPPPLKSKDTGAFVGLLSRFSPATAVDAQLIKAAWLTAFAGLESGQRPAYLIQSTDDDKQGGRGCGKTTLAELIGRLCGGHVEIRANDAWDTIVTRLLSPAAMTKRIAILDNVKTLKFSWAELEAGITAATISGRRLYHGEGQRPNTITYFVTLNGANMSKDMAQRCVPIMLTRPTYNASWEEDVIRLIEGRRWEIISDIVNILRAPGRRLTTFSRWSIWEKAVLSRVDDPEKCQALIAERQAAIDEDQSESDTVADGVRGELFRRGHVPEKECIWIPSADIAQLLNRLENEPHRAFNRAMTHLYTLNIPEIRKSKSDGERGCLWTGLSVPLKVERKKVFDPPASKW